MKKRIVSLVLAVAMVLSVCTPASAKNADTHLPSVAGGMSHTLAVDKDGKLWAWGLNTAYQLGLGKEVTQCDTPQEVTAIDGVTAVAAGYSHSLALRYNGEVYEWGSATIETPRKVAGLSGVVVIAAGQKDNLALKVNGEVWQWELGKTPSKVQGLPEIVTVSVGGVHCMALSRTGDVWVWGSNSAGQMGTGVTTGSANPVKLYRLVNIVDIAAGYDHSLAVDFSGKVYAWGNNKYFELGSDELTNEECLVPQVVPGLSDIVQVSAGNASSMALDKDGRVYTWGYGEYGQLGSGKGKISSAEPQTASWISGRSDSIASGVYHNISVSKSGALLLWGRNQYGQLGNGKNENANAPEGIKTIVSTERYESCVLSGISSWARSEAEELYKTELVSPLLLGSYQSYITRAELAHLLVTVYEQAKDTTAGIPKENRFTDIENHQLADDILKAYKLGFISGTSDTTFEPYAYVTRQEAAKMICSFYVKMRNMSTPSGVKNISYYYDAANVDEWAVPYVWYAYENGIMKGSDGMFYPKDRFTREEGLLTIARLVKANGWTAN